MAAAKTRKKRKPDPGQHAFAGRGFFATAHLPQAQRLGLRILARGALLLLVVLLASSTISDPLQSIVRQALGDLRPDAVQMKQAALLRRVADDADAVRGLDGAQLTLLFGAPELQRHEAQTVSWHYVCAECALDLYFRQGQAHPVYAEYRMRGDEAPQTHQSCVEALAKAAAISDARK